MRGIGCNQFIIFSMLVCLLACNEELDIQGYVAYFDKKDNGLTNTIAVDSSTYSVSLKSREYMALMNIGPEAMSLSKEALKEQINETEDYTYVFFKVQNDGLIIKIDSIVRIEQINYFQSGIMNDVSLINNEKRIFPCMSTYVSSNNILNQHTIILAFPVAFSKIEKQLKFVVNKGKFFTKDLAISINNKKTPELSF